MKKGKIWLKRSLVLLLSLVLASSCVMPGFASMEDKTTFVDDDGVLHIFGNYAQAFAGKPYTSIIAEKGAVLDAEIEYTVPVTLIGADAAEGESAKIVKGTFTSTVTNKGLINGGTFTGSLTNRNGTISNGTFNNATIDNTYGYINGGTFNTCTFTVSRTGISGGEFKGCTVNVSGAASIFGGHYDADCNIVNAGGMFSIGGGTFDCAVTGSPYITDGTFNGTVTNTGMITGGTFNGNLINQKDVRGDLSEGKKIVLNGDVENSGTICGAEIKDLARVTGEGKIYVTVNFYKSADVKEQTLYRSFAMNDNVLEGLARWDKENHSASTWQRLQDGEGTAIQGEEKFSLNEDNNFIRTPVWYIDGTTLTVLSDWNGASPAAPSSPGSYRNLQINSGVTLSGGSWQKTIVNEGKITGGTFTGTSVTNSGEITGGTFKVDSISNTGSIKDASIGKEKPGKTTLYNNESGTILSCAYSANVVVGDCTNPGGIAVPVIIHKKSLDDSPIIIKDKANFHRNIKEWLKEQHEEDTFSHKNGIAIDDTETFREIRTYEFLMGFTYRFDWHKAADGSHLDEADFYVKQQGKETKVGPATVTKEVIPPTCVEDGKTIHTATIEYENQTFTEDHEHENGKATGHQYDDAHIVWNWSDDYSSATADVTCTACGQLVKQGEAAEISTQTIAATCIAAGSKTHTATIQIDDKTFTNVKTEEIEMLPHTYPTETPEWVWAEDYSTASLTFTCSQCSTPNTVQAEVMKEEREATCTAAGEIVYDADLNFNGKSYSDTKVVTTPVKPHTYGEPVWTWEGEKATAKFTCSGCQRVEEKEANVVKTNVPSTCTKQGEDIYTATVNFENQDYTNVKKVPLDLLEHKYDTEPTWRWDGHQAYAVFTCSVGGETYEVKAEMKNEVSKAATCADEGEQSFTATVSMNGKQYTDKRTLTIPVTNEHTDKDNNGVCEVCGKTFDPSKTCSHICHKDGFLGLIWKIINFFNRIFKTNPTCSCGAAHY